MPVRNTSSSPAAERLVRVPLDRLRPHPANANRMSEPRRAKLQANIARSDRYPPIVARPHPEEPDVWQILDGHQRWQVLQDLGRADALVFPWHCDDATALLLLATLNRLEGEDVPGRRAALFAELTALIPPGDLALLVPEDPDAIDTLLALHQPDLEAILAELEASAAALVAELPRPMTFAVEPGDVDAIEAALARAMADRSGANRRGRALAAICRAFLQGDAAPAEA